MIEYVQILNTDKTPIGIIDTAKSIIWHSVYFGVGDFEIYIEATPNAVELLQIGNYVTRNGTNDVGIIEGIEVKFDLIEGYMMTATGRFAKSILDRRIIYTLSGTINKPTVISGLVEVAARTLVSNNAISCSFDSNRNIPNFTLGVLKNFQTKIVDENGDEAERQVVCENLLDYTDALLQEYGYGAKVHIDTSNNNFLYTVYTGTNRSSGNSGGNEPIILCTDYDNLTSSDYLYNLQPFKNTVLIGGEGDGSDRFYSLLTGSQTGFDRRETFIEASLNKTYVEEGTEAEIEYTDTEYSAMLKQQGQLTLSEAKATEEFNGEIDVSYGTFQFNRDYFIGDIVTVQDNKINKFINRRITETTEVQDENGYSVDIVFGDV